MSLFQLIAQWLIVRTLRRQPDFVIAGRTGTYLRRWYLIPRNPIFNLYLHRFMESDDDRALHDHMYFNLSIILAREVEGRRLYKGPAYIEITRRGSYQRAVGQVIARAPWTMHRITLPAGYEGREEPVWSLFITGPRIRQWGFLCPQGWRRHDLFSAVKTDENGQKVSTVSRGCD